MTRLTITCSIWLRSLSIRSRSAARSVTIVDVATDHLRSRSPSPRSHRSGRGSHALPGPRRLKTRSSRATSAARVARPPDLLELGAKIRVVRQPREQHLAVAGDRSQEVVEVVRDAARKPAHRLHLLRLEQLGFEQSTLLFRANKVADVFDRRYRRRQVSPFSPKMGAAFTDSRTRSPSRVLDRVADFVNRLPVAITRRKGSSSSGKGSPS